VELGPPGISTAVNNDVRRDLSIELDVGSFGGLLKWSEPHSDRAQFLVGADFQFHPNGGAFKFSHVRFVPAF